MIKSEVYLTQRRHDATKIELLSFALRLRIACTSAKAAATRERRSKAVASQSRPLAG
jgi:hypothetical protein